VRILRAEGSAWPFALHEKKLLNADAERFAR
jgi:hypothetical protein